VSGEPVPGSFRDPSGVVFTREGTLYRQVNQGYAPDFDRLLASGLYEDLIGRGLLVAHEEVDPALALTPDAYRVIRPERIPFISYPYEWCFGQLKAAALATLRLHSLALDHGMVLKDASAYNLQFVGARPVLVDTLSFARYQPGEPWVAYRQFCQHFLAPLALMRHRHVDLARLLRACIDGIPLDLASRLLPRRTRLGVGLGVHIHLHASMQRRHARRAAAPSRGRGMGLQAMRALIASLEAAVRRLTWRAGGTEWADYYQETNYSDEARQHKEALVADFLAICRPQMVWDLGANTGLYSRVASRQGAYTVAMDVDPAAVELNYREAAREKDSGLLPLVMDLTNPSPALGWSHTERMSLLERGPADAALMLALVHHLAIGNNVPLPMVAAFAARCCRNLIVEFVPKEDSQVQRLLASRVDIFPDYHREGFERAFAGAFETTDCRQIKGSERTLYLMRARG